MEIWKDIKGFEGIYKISNTCKIIKISGRNKGLLKISVGRLGYNQIRLINKNGIRKTFIFHRLMAINFIPNIENKPCVNHINGIKTDNRIENLEWCTHSENLKHSYNILKNKPGQKDKIYGLHNTSKPIIQYDLNGNFIREWDCAKRAIDETGITHIYCNLNNPKIFKTAGGYIWKKKNKQ